MRVLARGENGVETVVTVGKKIKSNAFYIALKTLVNRYYHYGVEIIGHYYMFLT